MTQGLDVWQSEVIYFLMAQYLFTQPIGFPLPMEDIMLLMY